MPLYTPTSAYYELVTAGTKVEIADGEFAPASRVGNLELACGRTGAATSYR